MLRARRASQPHAGRRPAALEFEWALAGVRGDLRPELGDAVHADEIMIAEFDVDRLAGHDRHRGLGAVIPDEGFYITEANNEGKNDIPKFPKSA